MAFEFRLPDIGEGVVEGEVVRWLVTVGEVVREDQPMVEVMTDKATVEIPSPKAGRVLSLDAPEGKMCKVGQVMVRIDTAATSGTHVSPPATVSGGLAATGAVGIQAARAQEVSTPAVSAGPASFASQQSAPGLHAVVIDMPRKVLATPATRKLARDLGVELHLVPATGNHGRITTPDVRAFAGGAGQSSPMGAAAISTAPTLARDLSPAVQATPDHRHFADGPPTLDLSGGDERIPFRGVRKKIAENMSRSKQTAAHFTYVEEADLTDLVALRARARKRAEERGIKLSFLPFIIKAVVAGLKKFPVVNSTLDEAQGEIVLRKRYHIGVAAASQQGLMVTVLRDADKKSIFEIARELEELAEKARTGKASRDELTGSTFTISSLGNLGGVLATPIINHPEVAILGVHKIKPTPVVRDGQIVIREIANFSISLDHRIVDGYEGAQFLQHVLALLSDPTLMFLELV